MSSNHSKNFTMVVLSYIIISALNYLHPILSELQEIYLYKKFATDVNVIISRQCS